MNGRSQGGAFASPHLGHEENAPPEDRPPEDDQTLVVLRFGGIAIMPGVSGVGAEGPLASALS